MEIYQIIHIIQLEIIMDQIIFMQHHQMLYRVIQNHLVDIFKVVHFQKEAVKLLLSRMDMEILEE